MKSNDVCFLGRLAKSVADLLDSHEDTEHEHTSAFKRKAEREANAEARLAKKARSAKKVRRQSSSSAAAISAPPSSAAASASVDVGDDTDSSE